MNKSINKNKHVVEDHSISGPVFSRGRECAFILRSLPEWFGIEEAIVKYTAEIDHLPTWLVHHQDQSIGFLSIKEHNAFSAELYVMGILKEWHHQGIGRSLITRAQDWLKEKGTEYFQVKTLAPSREDEHYAKTRSFYGSMGFRPLEEFKQIWDEDNPCLVMVKRI